MRIQDAREIVWSHLKKQQIFASLPLFFILLFIYKTDRFLRKKKFAGDNCFWHSFSSENKTRKKEWKNSDDNDDGKNRND